MKKRTTKELIIRIIILLVGLTIAHLGVTLFLLSDLGADPFNVLIQGIFRTLSARLLPEGVESGGLAFLTHGNVHRIACLLIIVVLLFVDRSYIKIGTVICMFVGGPIIDVYLAIFDRTIGNSFSLIQRGIMLPMGCIILAFGMTIVIKSDAGTGPNDLVAIIISDKSRARFGIVRIVVDFLFVAVGFFLGGVAGIGTIVCAFLVGPVADFFLPINEKMVNKIIGDSNITKSP